MHLAATVGRVDCVISSTDKNFLVRANFCTHPSKPSESSIQCVLHLQLSLHFRHGIAALTLRRFLSVVVCCTN